MPACERVSAKHARHQRAGVGPARNGRTLASMGKIGNAIIAVFAGLVITAWGSPAVVDRTIEWDTGTFSILGYDPATGEVGGAVQSRVFSVGNGVLWAEANVGVAATQAIVDVSYGPQALELLRKGMSPSAIVKQIWEQDPDPL